MKNILIITGGSVDLTWARGWLDGKKFDYCTAADKGLEAACALGVKVDYLLGDYDSVDKSVLARYEDSVKNDRYPSEKDYTDTELAVTAAIQYINENRTDGESYRVTIIGASGTRLDHTFASVSLLKRFADAGIEAYIIDAHNRIRMMSGNSEIRLKKEEQFGDYVSCIAVTPSVAGLTMRGFKYPLENYELPYGVGLCVSNEIKDDEATIIISGGKMLILETRD